MNNLPINIPYDWAEAFRRLPPNWDTYGGVPSTEESISATEDIVNNGQLTIIPSGRGGIFLNIYTQNASYLIHVGPDGEQLND